MVPATKSALVFLGFVLVSAPLAAVLHESGGKLEAQQDAQNLRSQLEVAKSENEKKDAQLTIVTLQLDKAERLLADAWDKIKKLESVIVSKDDLIKRIRDDRDREVAALTDEIRARNEDIKRLTEELARAKAEGDKARQGLIAEHLRSADLDKKLAQAKLNRVEKVHATVQELLDRTHRPPDTEQALTEAQCQGRGEAPGCKGN
jgi:chromosome segregation ATPase